MSELQKAADKLIEVVEGLELDVSDAVNDDVSTIAILGGGTLSPGQLANDDIQWVFSHLLGDIVEALDTQDPDVLEQVDPPLIDMAEALEKTIGTITNEDLREQIEELISGDDDAPDETDADGE